MTNVLNITNISPLVKWSGGKGDEIPIIKKYIPKKYERYIEPFVGGGACFFKFAQHSSEKSNVINDIHPALINFYKEIKKGNGKKIYSLMKKYPNEEKTYYYIRDEYKPKNKTEEAFVFYYLRKTCYRGMLRYNKSGHFNVPFGRYKKVNYEELINENYFPLFSNTTILNKSFPYIFEKYNEKTDFIFLDPPYDSKFTDYGYCKFGKEEHALLAEYFKKSKAKCLMIIGDTPFIRELYEDYIVFEYDKKYRFKLHSGRVGNEINNKHLVIKNY
jgi:DNA adenine methylase